MTLRFLTVAAVLASLGAGAAHAQPQPAPTAVNVVAIPGVGTATVLTYNVRFVSADPATRRVVLETPSGLRWAVVAPPLVGDLGYFRNGQDLIIRKLPGIVTALRKAERGNPGEVLNEVVVNAGLPGLPEGFGIREVTLTSILVAIDPAGGTLTFEGPDGAVRIVKASDQALIDPQKVQAGDLAQITYLEGLAINAVN